MKYKSIGILGGMGPEATAQLYLEIIKIFQNEFGAVYDDDFPEMVIINVPIPDVVANTKTQDQVKKQLINAAIKLERAGVDFIAIPCNTVMIYLKEIEKNISIPTLNIVEETARIANTQSVKKIGVIATKKTIREKIYETKLANKEVIYPLPNEQDEVTQIILNILSGKKLIKDQKFLFELITNLRSQGAQKIILGCTELPLLVSNDETLNSIEILAQSIVRCAAKINGGQNGLR